MVNYRILMLDSRGIGEFAGVEPAADQPLVITILSASGFELPRAKGSCPLIVVLRAAQQLRAVAVRLN